jgi:pentatricopeptide repeat protein
MQLQGIEPDAFAFSSILKACGDAEKGFELHKQINQDGFETDLGVGAALIGMYAVCGCFAEAQEVFDELPRRSVAAWNALIGGFVDRGAAERALELFHKMKHEEEDDDEEDDDDKDDDEEDCEDGIFPDAFTYAHVLKACGLLRDAESGRFAHAEAVLKGFDDECFVGSTAVSMYAKSGLLADAKAVFEHLKAKKELVSWTALIAGYAEHGAARDALECFGEMQDSSGVPPDDFTLASAIRACASIGAIAKGRAIHGEALKAGFERDLCVGTALLDMYAKSASRDEARSVFDKLPIRDVTSWNALICGLSDHGGQMALDCFAIMRRERAVMPDSITFSGLLTACAHSSLVTEGRDIFRMMVQEYGISPSADHYTCMIDLLARAGRLREAAKSLETTPSPPSIQTWRDLLNACKLYGEAELGSKCFRHLLRIDPDLAASHVALVADVYAGSESWGDQAITLDGIETF